MTDERPGRDAFAEALGRAIQVLRTDRGLSRRELADLAGISYSYLSAIEGGTKPPSTTTLGMLARALGLHHHELVAAAEARMGSTPREWLEPDEAVVYRSATPPPVADPLAGPGATPPRSDLGRIEELRALLERMDDADAEFLLEMARKLANRRR